MTLLRDLAISRKKFRAMLLSSALGGFVTFLVLLSDTLIVGNMVGEAGIGGISLISPLYSVTAFFANIIATGSSFAYTAAIGRMEKKRADVFFGDGLLLSLLFGVLIYLAMEWGLDAYLRFMDCTEEIRAHAVVYAGYLKYAMALMPMELTLGRMIYVDGDDGLFNLQCIVLVLNNIGLTILLTWKMGTGGASLATAIATAVDVLLPCLHFFKRSNRLRPAWAVRFADLREIVTLSIVDAVWMLCLSVLSLAMNKYIIAAFGDRYLPVLALGVNVFELSLVLDGIGRAHAPMAAVYLGEGNPSAERTLTEYALKFALGEGIFWAALMAVLAPLVPGAFRISDPELIREGVVCVRLVGLSLPLYSVILLFTSQYLQVRHIRLAVIITVVTNVVLILLFSVGLGALAGLRGAWLGYTVTPAVSLLLFGLIVRLRYGRERFPYLLEPEEGAVLNFSFPVTREDVLAARDRAEAFLRAREAPDSLRRRAMLLIEELGLLTLERNPGKTVTAEYSLLLRGGELTLVCRDDGTFFDVTDPELELSGLRSFLVNRLLQVTAREYLTTIRFNRIVLRLTDPA